jgi:hypothetical protein
MPIIDLAGQRFGRLVVVSVVGRRHSQALWQCKCDCGNEAQIVGQVLRKGASQSCGCLLNEFRGKASTTHGQSKSLVYKVWATMRNRCNRPNVASYPNYGGRGIKVCDAWNSPDGFVAFAEDMGPRPKGGMIERLDNNGNYCPENCIWAQRLEQVANKRNNNLITANGATKHLADWAREVGGTSAAIIHRIELGWTLERAVSERVPDRPNAKLTPDDAVKIRSLYPDKTQMQLASMFNVDQKSIANVLHGRTFSDIESGPVNLDWKSNKVRSKFRATSRILAANGEEKTLSEWAKTLGLSPNTIHARLKNGWNEHDAVTVHHRPHGSAKLTLKDAANIRVSHPAMSQRKLAALYGVDKKSIQNVLEGKTFRQ